MALKLTIWLSPGSDTSHDFEFDAAEVVLGRDPQSDLPLPFSFVSGSHCTIVVEGSSYLLSDHGSTNGTIHNGKRLPSYSYTPIHTGDLIAIGEILIQVDVLDELTSSMSLEETGEEVRQMVFETLAGKGATTAPTLEWGSGETFTFPNETMRIVIGSGADDDVTVTGDGVTPGHLVLEQVGVAWRAHPNPNELAHVDGRPLTEPFDLGPEHRLRVGDVQIVFRDPLYAYFDDVTGSTDDADSLSSLHEVLSTQQIRDNRSYDLADGPRDFGPPDRPPQPARDRLVTSATDSQRISSDEPVSRGWGAFEIGVVVVTAVLVMAGLTAILVLFNVI